MDEEPTDEAPVAAEEADSEEAASDEDEAWISADTAEEAEVALPAEAPSQPEE